MAELPPNLPNLWKNLDHFQSVITKVHESLTNPTQKQALGELLGKLQEARANAEKVVPEVVNGMQKKNEALKAWAEDFQTKIAEKRQELDALKAAAAQKPKKAAPTPTGPTPRPPDKIQIVPGQTLREEMLDQLGAVPHQPASSESDREIWKDLSQVDRLAQASSDPDAKADAQRPAVGRFRAADHGISPKDIKKLARDFLDKLHARRESGEWTNW